MARNKRSMDLWRIIIFSLIIFISECQCDYYVNGKLHSGNIMGDSNYHHIIVEEADDSRVSRPGSTWTWPEERETGARIIQAGCYELHRTGERIDSRFIHRVLRTRNRRECEEECDRSNICEGFNYRFKTQGFDQFRDNCELSKHSGDITFDFHNDMDFDFYKKNYYGKDCYASERLIVENTTEESSGSGGSWTNQDGYGNNYGGGYYGGREDCFRLAEKDRALSERQALGSLTARDIRECEMACERSWQFVCKLFSFRYNSVGLSPNCLLSDMEYNDHMNYYNLIQDRGSDLYARQLYGRECGGGTGTTWPNYYGGTTTVSGMRCHREPCRMDIQGFYYCEVDYSGAWDYCCKPGERCDYSDGYNQRWCNVGRDMDMWRPCVQSAFNRDFLKGRSAFDSSSSNTTTTNTTSTTNDTTETINAEAGEPSLIGEYFDIELDHI